MPTGERGFTYLWLLFAIAIGGATLAALSERWSVAIQREKEVELGFRGKQIARAIAAYWQATPGSVKELPASLDELLDDRRNVEPRRHLRRIWRDPFTGRTDWTLIAPIEGAGIAGVQSRSTVRAFDISSLASAPAGQPRLVSERQFVFVPPTGAAPASAPARRPS